MQVHLTGKHVEITPGLRQHMATKISKLEELFPKVKKAVVVLSVEKYRHTVEIHFRADGVEMSAKKTTKDMYASVEEAVAALEQQAAKRKDRLHTSSALRRSAGRTERKAGRKASAQDDEAPAAAKPKIVRLRAATAKPMDVEDALAQLEGSGEAFLLFREPRHGSVQLLFKRENGSYGLMEA